MLDKQFVSSEITERLPDVWQIKVVYSYYGLYNFEQVFIEASLDKALHRLLVERCGNRLRVVNQAGVNLNIEPADDKTTAVALPDYTPVPEDEAKIAIDPLKNSV